MLKSMSVDETDESDSNNGDDSIYDKGRAQENQSSSTHPDEIDSEQSIQRNSTPGISI